MRSHRAHPREAAALVVAVLVALAVPTLSVVPATAGTGAPARTAAGCVAPGVPFVPTVATIPAIDRSVGVVGVRRTAAGAVGSPPLSKRGKWLIGLDPQAWPGDGEGTVIMTAHTWPDGSALGNALLGSLRAGDRLVLGDGDGAAACYQVTKRRKYGASRVPRKKAFRWWGPEQVVIVVCSGKRLGPGRWTHRTIWYATPVVDG
ncbi:class F sortase [Pimelobacter simplex]|uniref:class F sortase n=1 Tax=Nocardioides simplex TaxID=2045 RepID=UPI0019337B9C|nr:class F sortase [Pimelobacter simplex]